ncbi:MAG: polyprenyl synthetase family protein [Bacteroidales bacterium]|nr:polyprenyl synthetase family protein [Bacteroidales bacterium]
MAVIDQIKAPINDEMKRFVPYFRNVMRSDSKLLDSVIQYCLKTKGKQMRPMLVFLCAKVAGTFQDSSMVAASLIELLHTATLIHDDVVDESFYRRGFFSVFALWKAKIAVLTGDYFLAQGLLHSLNSDQTEILRIVSNAVRDMSEGELEQLEHANRLNITEDSYYQIIRKKTGALISACCEAGAHSSGADKDTVALFKEFGMLIGMAFQIKDDLFDYQQTGLIGKPKYNDIQERKMTLPVIHSIYNSNFVERKAIFRLFKKKSKSSADIKRIIEFVHSSGGVKYSVDKMNELKDKAISLLDKFPESEAKKSLILLAEYVVSRDK